ncbi:MAG: hypothetical protein ABSH05_17240 [Bryobacteraceae bacterium]|jgi:hypothetical protein
MESIVDPQSRRTSSEGQAHLEDRLDRAIVNPDCVAEVVLNTGVRLEVSRRRVKELLERLGGADLAPRRPVL